MRTISASFAAAARLAVMISVAACGADAVTPPSGNSPLAGLSLSATNDTSQGALRNGSGAGAARGQVLEQAAPGATGDTLTVMPRIAGVKVTVYAGTAANGVLENAVEVGSTTTDASGAFTLPTLAAGEYTVTFVPPVTRGLNGAYVTAWISENSGKYPWWVVLSRK
jgi:hypothetical protein